MWKNNVKDKGCAELEKLLESERDIIEKHIDEHKWFRHIADKNEAVMDFINEYGWIMKEMYCKYVCKHKRKCEVQYKLKDEVI